MDGQKLKKHVLGSKKTERIIFAATPEMKEASEMKEALETIAQEKCVSLSALLTSLAVEEILANKGLFAHVATAK